MKRLPATSFFLFAIFLLAICACESEVEQKKKKSPEITSLKNKVTYLIKKEAYDSAIFYQNKLIQVAVRLKDSSSIQFGYFNQFKNYEKTGNKDSTYAYLQKWYDMSEMMNDLRWMASASKRQGDFLNDQENFQEAFSKFSRAKNLYLQINDSINAGKVLLSIANLQKKEGSFGESQLSALEGLEYLESTDELKTLSGLYHVLSVTSKEIGQDSIAIQRNNQALALAKDSSSIKKIGEGSINIFKNTKANIFKELGKYDEAIAIYEDLLIVEKNNTIEAKRVAVNMAHTLFLKNGYNKTSDSILKDAASYYASIPGTSELFSTQLKLAQIYKDINKKKSSEYINEALSNANKLGNPKSILEVLEVKINLTGKKEDFERYLELTEKIKIDRENLNYLYANERFDLDKSERERAKAKNDAIISENKATKFKNQLLALIIVLIVLLVLTFFIYQKIKRRHKIEKVKTIHVTEARISSKVHDELANDLYKLISQLETTDPEKEVILDKLDFIYNQARDISKQIQGVETEEGFAEELNNLFRSYQSEEVNVLLKRYNTDIWNGISAHIKVTVYRVLQELLTNMKKHSNAGLVVVSIEKQQKQLFIQYIDNGKGFTKEISKNGLLNAENRIHAIKGKLTFDTELHKGCKFSINVPV